MSVERERDEVSVGKMVAVMALFLVVGGVALIYVWRVLNQLLTGQDPRQSLWVALGLVVVFVILLRIFRGWIGRLGGSEG